MTCYLAITPRDPIIARDGRPFGRGQGVRMRSLDWPLPSVLAGSLRTLLGKQTPSGFCPETVEKLKSLAIAGPLPVVNGRLYLPIPADLVVRARGHGEEACLAARPSELRSGEGCDLPAPSLRPVLLPLADKDEDFKPARVDGFLSIEKTVEWLRSGKGEGLSLEWNWEKGPPRLVLPDGLNALDKDERVHVHIDPHRGAASESELFISVGVDCNLAGGRARHHEVIEVAARVSHDEPFKQQLDQLDHLHPFGGERRLVRWKRTEDLAEAWSCPKELADLLATASKVRLVLATPAIFADGWKPRWLQSTDHGLIGTVPNTSVRLRLIAVSSSRWQPVSGWSLERGRVGPKPIWRLVPSGAVYF
ncbi:MAG: CRISPR-associated protein Cmr3, partial [Planctomycetes bacterium]|nr:CRISPR-associated protein Cmr3 [Planctomycetota bacterium]